MFNPTSRGGELYLAIAIRGNRKAGKFETITNLSPYRIAHNVSSRKRVEIIARAKQLSVKVTNAKAKVTTEV